MKKDNVLNPSGRETISDAVTELLKTRAQQLLQQVIEAKQAQFMQQFEARRLEDGRAAVVRNGYQPERELQTSIGSVNVSIPKVRACDDEPVSFRSALVPPYAYKTKSLEAALPWLYLKDASTCEMGEALEVLSWSQAKGLSESTEACLKQ